MQPVVTINARVLPTTAATDESIFVKQYNKQKTSRQTNQIMLIKKQDPKTKVPLGPCYGVYTWWYTTTAVADKTKGDTR